MGGGIGGWRGGGRWNNGAAWKNKTNENIL